VIRVLRQLRLSLGRELRPIKPLASWDLPPGSEIALPPELEALLVREGLAAEMRERAVMTTPETR